ncbi:MAG: sugar transferase [Burkholderiales bacterium]|nr:sugar transferase [Phycisphaerae bacterium]
MQGSNQGMVTTTTTSSAGQTIWGLDAIQLHSHYWASLGVQVVRQGEPSQIVPHAELYLLTDPRTLPMFRLKPAMNMLEWIEPHVLTIRLHDTREKTYRERAISDDTDRFLKFERVYDASGRLARVMLTPERELAELWMAAPDPRTAFRRIKRFVPRHERVTMSLDGKTFDRTSDDEIASLLNELVREWKRPDSTIPRARHKDNNGVWIDPESRIATSARLLGNVWVGAGRQIDSDQVIVGPAVMWDDPETRPQTPNIDWMMIEPSEPPQDLAVQSTATSLYLTAKRGLDIVLALIGLVLTLPMWLVVMFLIWLEDGGPFFFGHMRETRGGREFMCWKFRSMKNGAENMKELIAKHNQVDGPQVYIDNDPRITRIGNFIRRYNIDEFPQFWNVLRGDMSMVGPRPSPRKENQYCPAWREARLSVRPGITGLWQIRRTRNKGSDFQEWIKYDIEYVENMSMWRDLKIIYKTVSQLTRKGARS